MSESLLPNASAPDFDDPLGLLAACHQRILAHCDLLERMADHVNTYDWDDDALSAASRALKYFSTAAQDHHADEEIDLFPLLQQRGDDELDRLINELGSQHQALSTAWQPVAHWLSSHEAVSSDTRRQILELVRQYRTHVQLENEKLLPCASSNLKEPDISKLGAAMKRRRGL